MKTNISEDLPARKFVPAANTGGGSAVGGGGDMEKRARAAIHDSKYRVKKDMGPDTKLDPAAFIEAVIEKLRNSQYDLPIKTRAIQILRGDGQKKEIKEFASQNVARALYSVFVEQPSKLIDEEYIEKLKEELSKEYQNPEQRKYKVRVTDKDTKNSYIRWANRSKINELRANPNIASVEMLDLYGSPEPNESERTKGAQTASVTAGKGLKNNDGNLANNYPPYNKVTRGDVIAGATGKDQMGGKKKVREEFIGEKDNGDKNKPIEPMKGKRNKCKVYDPSGSGRDSGGEELRMHQELEGEVIAETGYSKFLTMVNEKMNLAAANMGDVVKDFQKSDAPQFKGKSNKNRQGMAIAAKLTAERGGKKLGEEMECDSDKNKEDDEKEDPRSMKTKVNLVKNKLRAMGLKMSYEPEGDVIDEAEQRIRQPRQSANPRGTYDPTGIGQHPRTGKERKKMRKGEPVPQYPELKPRNNSGYNNNYDKEHPALTASQRNTRPG